MQNTKPEPGCYIDSHLGHYAHAECVKLAIAFGMPIDPFADWAIQKYDDCSHESEYPNEAIHELCDEAEAFLNERQAVDGHYWGWNDGDFGLYPIEDDE